MKWFGRELGWIEIEVEWNRSWSGLASEWVALELEWVGVVVDVVALELAWIDGKH